LKGVIRIEPSEINLSSGLTELRLYQLRKSQPLKDLVGIVVLQINDLLEFLGRTGKMTANNIFDTAEIIIEKFDILSFRLIQDCFNRIKKSEPPFNDELYNSITGRKIMTWLDKYLNIVDDHLFADANKKVYSDSLRIFDKQVNKTEQGLFNVAGAFKELNHNLKKLDLVNNKKQ
jgi:hypothetical protein